MAKDAYYFSHDSNAKDDPKCVLLIEQLGLEGYGIFWVLIETLRDQPEYKYPVNLIPALARRYNTTAEKMKAVVNGYSLFMVDEQDFFSLSLMRRMEVIEEKREKARKSIAARWDKQKQLPPTDTNEIRTYNERNTDELQGKERKVKESKENKTTTMQQQFKNLISVFNNNIHMITPVEFESLKDWAEDIEPEAIELAIQQAVKNGVRTLKYIEGILKKWQDLGIKTKQDAEAQIRDFADKKNVKPTDKPAPQTKELTESDIEAAQYYINMRYQIFKKDAPTEQETIDFLNSFEYPKNLLKEALDRLGLVEYYTGGE